MGPQRVDGPGVADGRGPRGRKLRSGTAVAYTFCGFREGERLDSAAPAARWKMLRGKQIDGRRLEKCRQWLHHHHRFEGLDGAAGCATGGTDAF